MSGAPATDPKLDRRVAQLEREIRRLRFENKQTYRLFSQAWPENIRIAQTVRSANDNPPYPNPPANVYRIELTDSHFSGPPGQRAATHTRRGEKLLAFDLSGNTWIAEGSTVVAFRSQGLGGAGKGRWWILFLVETTESESSYSSSSQTTESSTTESSTTESSTTESSTIESSETESSTKSTSESSTESAASETSSSDGDGIKECYDYCDYTWTGSEWLKTVDRCDNDPRADPDCHCDVNTSEWPDGQFPGDMILVTCG